MGSISNVNIPYFTFVELLAGNVSKFFMRKTLIIRNEIVSDSPNNTCNISMDAYITSNWKILEMFRPASEVQVKEMITKSPKKSSDLVLLPNWLFEKYMDQLLPLITAIISK